jgi:hypothetical protein
MDQESGTTANRKPDEAELRQIRKEQPFPKPQYTDSQWLLCHQEVKMLALFLNGISERS